MTNSNVQEKLSIDERRSQVQSLLMPDEIRNHRVSGGLELKDDQIKELAEIAKLTGKLTEGLHELSLRSLEDDPKDPTLRKVRQMLKLEGIAQAKMRGEIVKVELPRPEITKIDTILTTEGIKVVEVEPGKVRGIGYGAMVRQQGEGLATLGADIFLHDLADQENVAIVMSHSDRFHEPEMGVLSKLNDSIVVAPQMDIEVGSNGLVIKRGRHVAQKAIMMTSLVNKGISEDRIRNVTEIVSDRRSDLELKTALALVHNSTHDADLEQLLQEVFPADLLDAARNMIPQTMHSSQMTYAERDELVQKISADELGVFLKPIADSGTRGIVTPDDQKGILNIFSRPKELKKFVIQQACDITMVNMKSTDVLTGHEGQSDMNVRITLHVNKTGEIIEVSVVGSPDKHLAHGGKTSIITNIEKADDE
jgi:hypothetical protein